MSKASEYKMRILRACTAALAATAILAIFASAAQALPAGTCATWRVGASGFGRFIGSV